MIARIVEKDINRLLQNFPITGIVGPRQCGKSTIAKKIISKRAEVVYLDLERASDLARLNDPETYLSAQKGKLVCIDEIQRKPELFPLIRSLVDDWNYNGAFLILGSASRDMLRQSSESLAGRIAYKTLSPLIFPEIAGIATQEQYYYRGGFPRSFLSNDDSLSMEWRESFITTFLERDLLQWRNFTPSLMGRLWQMLAHNNGQTVNYSSLGNSLGLTSATIKTYIDLLESTFMVTVLPTLNSNLGKRLVKSPKIYVADSGITTALLRITDYSQLAGHPAWGNLWEQIVLINLKALFPKSEYFFYRTTNGAEIDIVMRYGEKTIAIECKSSVAPSLTKGNFIAIQDIEPTKTIVVAPVINGWPLKQEISVMNIAEIIDFLTENGMK